jgi:hypothetical protein
LILPLTLAAFAVAMYTQSQEAGERRQCHCVLVCIEIQKLAVWVSDGFIGHEIVGRAVKVGSNVKDVKVGDRVGVGAQISSDMTCVNCKNQQENYCPVCKDAAVMSVSALTAYRIQSTRTVLRMAKMVPSAKVVMLRTFEPTNTLPSQFQKAFLLRLRHQCCVQV